MKHKTKMIWVLVGIFFMFSIGCTTPWEKLDPKQMVVSVKPILHSTTRSTIYGIGDLLVAYGRGKNREPLVQAGQRLKKMIDSEHGSGFFYLDSQGENYIIANQHVVGTAQNATITFKDGNTIQNARILYSDDNLDISILQPEDRKKYVKKSVSLNSSYDTNDEVFAAGFPGSPTNWEFQKGKVTTQSEKKGENQYIRHSAYIDTGSSGGPLFMKSGIFWKTYSVIGANTMYVPDRPSGNYFAVPAGDIESVLSKAKAVKNLSRSQIEGLCQTQAKYLSEYINDKNANLSMVEKMISNEIISKEGFETFREVGSLPDKTQNIVLSAVIDDPIKAFKSLIAFRISFDLRVDRGSGMMHFNSLASSTADRVKTVYTMVNGSNRTQREIEWVFEHGHCRISSVANLRNFAEMADIISAASNSQESSSNSNPTNFSHLDDEHLVKIIKVCQATSTSSDTKDLAECTARGILVVCKELNSNDEQTKACTLAGMDRILKALKE